MRPPVKALWYWLVIVPWAVAAALLLWAARCEGHEPAFIGPPAPATIGIQLDMVVTAYCVYNKRPTECDHGYNPAWHNKTASGQVPKRGLCAAHWDIWPRGTVFYIPGYGRCEVADKGGRGEGGRWLDVFMGQGPSAVKEAKQWGRQTLKVTLIRWGVEP